MGGRYPVRIFKCSSDRYSQSLMAEWLEDVKKEVLPPEEILGETDIEGVKLDFNFGLRLQIPSLGDDTLHVVIGNAENGEVYFDQEVSRVTLVSFELYFIPWQVDIFYHDAHVFSHTFNPKGQEIFFRCSSQALGDAIALLPYISDFAKRWECKPLVFVPQALREIVERTYPEFRLSDSLGKETYATFYLNVWLDVFMMCTPFNGRAIPMEQMGKLILGAPYTLKTAKYLPTKPRSIEEPYVCIGVQASGPWKGWHYPGGWDEVVAYLKEIGYRVLCIDRDYQVSEGELVIRRPQGTEDFTGNIPLMERVNLLAYADFFIGLSSGLAWLAYAVGCPVVMLVGFTYPWFEFETPYRVQNFSKCYGCLNDIHIGRIPVLNCPYHDGKEEEFECSRSITPRHVISTIERLRRDLREKRSRKDML